MGRSFFKINRFMGQYIDGISWLNFFFTSFPIIKATRIYSARISSIQDGFMVTDDKLLREWNKAAGSWVDFVRDGKDYFREEMNNPAAFNLIGSVKGKRILDLACGEGFNTRILARKGAKVVGVDFSKKMVKLAEQKELEDGLGISYYVSDAVDLKLFSSNHFDVVTCFMSLMDMERYKDAISEVARILKTKGRFIFSIPHPCFEYGMTTEGENIADWKYEEEIKNTSEEKAMHLVIKRYFGIFRFEVLWNMKRIVKPFKTTSFHRTLTNYSQALYENGLLIMRLVEPRPTANGVSKYSSLSKHTRIPHSLVIEAIKNDMCS